MLSSNLFQGRDVFICDFVVIVKTCQVDLLMMYYDPMTNYQCGHFQLICDVVEKNYIIITQDCGTNLDTSIKNLCISHDWSFLTCSHS